VSVLIGAVPEVEPDTKILLEELLLVTYLVTVVPGPMVVVVGGEKVISPVTVLTFVIVVTSLPTRICSPIPKLDAFEDPTLMVVPPVGV
tara:strand:+ start:1079 stop:1345 length:267 start_codon:yes stop_codon:yes gene_type:complete